MDTGKMWPNQEEEKKAGAPPMPLSLTATGGGPGSPGVGGTGNLPVTSSSFRNAEPELIPKK